MVEFRTGNICKHLQVVTRDTTDFERMLWEASQVASIIDPEGIVAPEAYPYDHLPKAPSTLNSYGCDLGGTCRGAKWYHTLFRGIEFNQGAAESCRSNV